MTCPRSSRRRDRRSPGLLISRKFFFISSISYPRTITGILIHQETRRDPACIQLSTKIFKIKSSRYCLCQQCSGACGNRDDTESALEELLPTLPLDFCQCPQSPAKAVSSLSFPGPWEDRLVWCCICPMNLLSPL